MAGRGGAKEAPGQSYVYKEASWLQEGHRSPIYCGVFNHLAPQLGDLLATVGGNRATIYNCRPSGEMEPLQAYVDADASEEYFVCAWSLDPATGAPLLLLAGKRGVLLAVDAATGRLAACMEGHGSSINDMAVHPTRPHLVVTASRDQSLRLWNLRTRCCVLVFQGDGGHRNEVLTLSWKAGDAPDGSQDLLLSAGMDNCVKVWGLRAHAGVLAASEEWRAGSGHVFAAGHVTMPLFSTERAHYNYVDCVRWLGSWVLSKSVDNRVVAWRPVLPQQAQHSGSGGGASGGGAAPTPGSATPGPASASQQRQGPAKDGDVELVQELSLEDAAGVWWLRFALDYWGAVLACGTAAGRVLVFDPHAVQPSPKARLRPRRATGKDRAPLVRQTAVSFDGSIVVACHEDGTLTRWDRATAGGGGSTAAGDTAAGGGSSRPSSRAAAEGSSSDEDEG